MFRSKAWSLGSMAALVAGFAFAQDPAPAEAGAAPDAAAVLSPSPLPFIAVTPCRGADTRGNGFTGEYGPPSLPGNSIRTFTIEGTCGVPNTAAAVSLNFTVTNNPTFGDIRVFPAGDPILVSTLNWGPQTGTIANAAIVPLSVGGQISVLVDGPGPIDLIYDVNGYYAGAAAGTQNLFLGQSAGAAVSSGDSNTAIGFGALQQISTGRGNIALGLRAGGGLAPNANNNICIGNGGALSDSNTTRIGSGQTRVFIDGIRGKTTKADGVDVIIDSSGQLGTVISSARFKDDVEDMDEASDGLLKLRPVTFRYKGQEGERRQFGLIAEEVEKVLPDLVVRDASGRPETVLYREIPTMLLNEVQKQHRTIEQQRGLIQALEDRLASMERQIREKSRSD